MFSRISLIHAVPVRKVDELKIAPSLSLMTAENSYLESDFLSRKILPEEFYLQNTLDVARALLGKIFVKLAGDAVLAGRIVETEAYMQHGDPSCHSFRGKNKRNEIMFGPSGRLYVYFIYGMHYCMNVVTQEQGIADAVLIRAVEPVAGIEDMKKNRGTDDFKVLAKGPARLCQAFAVGRGENGLSLQGPKIRIIDSPDMKETQVGRSPRIGISSAQDFPWRFYEIDSPFVSRNT